MDKETASHIEQLNKRIDDLRTFFSSLVAAGGVIVAVLGLVFAWNLDSEKDDIRRFKEEVKTDLRLKSRPPKLEFLTPDREPLKDHKLQATIIRDSDTKEFKLRFDFILANIGGSPSGPMSVKVYTRDPLVLEPSSTDEREFAYELFFQPSSNDPSEIAAGVSVNWRMNVSLKVEKSPPPGEYPVLIKFFYGTDKQTRAEFKVIVEKTT